MKILKLLAMLCVAATVCMSVMSCSKDDDDNTNSSLVGTWKDTYDSSNWDAWTFKSNGTCTWTVYDSGKTFVETGTYTYKHPVLKMQTIDEDEDEYIYNWTVKSISSTKLVIFDEDEEEEYIYYKE